VEKRRVIFSPEAAVDLSDLYEYIAKQSGLTRAINYIGRIEQYCAGFKFSPERGTKRDDLRPGLRIAGFERRITIAFHVQLDAVVIDRILYAGRDVKRAFRTVALPGRRVVRKF
jgi:plasmid stabilization system protein ParE